MNALKQTQIIAQQKKSIELLKADMFDLTEKNEELALENTALQAEIERLRTERDETVQQLHYMSNVELPDVQQRAEALERAIRAFEYSTGIFSFACFCCIYKDKEDIHKCELLGDEVCEDMENWELDQMRFGK